MLIKNNKKAVLAQENKTLRIAIVTSTYYEEITKNMESACVKFLIKSGVKSENIKTFYVPGSWEIPILVQSLAKSKKFDGIAAFGLILKGKTYHFEVLTTQCAKALMEISLNTNIPIAFEILSVYDLEQARKRTSGKINRGIEGAQALLRTIHSLGSIASLLE
ncbi:MAG: 6,7-dimethyl-8-ribityllumazine synthase [bacterium]|nr:6,7-dimethyl-8-ribityllumazine synthase [bacterium]